MPVGLNLKINWFYHSYVHYYISDSKIKLKAVEWYVERSLMKRKIYNRQSDIRSSLAFRTVYKTPSILYTLEMNTHVYRRIWFLFIYYFEFKLLFSIECNNMYRFWKLNVSVDSPRHLRSHMTAIIMTSWKILENAYSALGENFPPTH